MSCNHSEAIKAMQKASEFKGIKRLLYVLLDKHPKAVANAWVLTDKVGLPCPACGGSLTECIGVLNNTIVKCDACPFASAAND